jgi:hypothetical protein
MKICKAFLKKGLYIFVIIFRLENWKKFSNIILGQNLGNNVLRLNGEMNLENLVESISDSMENSS